MSYLCIFHKCLVLFVLLLCSVDSLGVMDATSGDERLCKIVSLAEDTDKASSLEVQCMTG